MRHGSCLSSAVRLAKIPLVKKTLKIVGALVSVVILFLAWWHVRHPQNEAVNCDTFTLSGEIAPKTFVQARECLVRSEAPKKTFVVAGSEGGDNLTALALGILIHRHGWDVEIVDYCLSACATFIFPAGKTISLHRQSLLAFHGGPHQENLLDQAKVLDEIASMNGARKEFVTIRPAIKISARTEFVTRAQSGTENTASIAPETPAYLEVLEFFSIPDDLTYVEGIIALRKAAEQFYQELGVNLLLPTYGQLGVYEPIYKSSKYQGFIYRLDSLRRFGIGNVELKEGEWHPERHFLYPEVYEVTYP